MLVAIKMRVSLFYLKLITILVVFLSLTSCASMDDHHGKMAATAIGAGLGAVAGLVIAQDPITGAIIGTVFFVAVDAGPLGRACP